MRLLQAIKAFFAALKQPEVKAPETTDPSHLRLLALLQRSGRLIDFLKEDIKGYSDAQIGAAVRKIHAETSSCLEEMVTIRPLFEQSEGSSVTIAHGFDPSEVKLVGNVKGEAPYKGVLRHKGWKAHKISLPKQAGEWKREVLCPAEIEIK